MTVRCGGIRQRTDAIKKTFDPEWSCQLEVNLTTDILQHKRRLRAFKKHGLCLAVYSKDKFSSIFLGQCSWSLDQLFTDNAISFEDSQVGLFDNRQNRDLMQSHSPLGIHY